MRIYVQNSSATATAIVMNLMEWQIKVEFMATHKTFAASVIIEIIKHTQHTQFIAGHVLQS